MQSLENQYQHLSPLDAFKARGRYLHSQLKKEGKGKAPDSQSYERESVDMSGAFDLDNKLQARKSNYRIVADYTPSIYSESALSDDLVRSSLHDWQTTVSCEQGDSSNEARSSTNVAQSRLQVSKDSSVQPQQRVSDFSEHATITVAGRNSSVLQTAAASFPRSPKTPSTQQSHFPARFDSEYTKRQEHDSPAQRSVEEQSSAIVQDSRYPRKSETPSNIASPSSHYRHQSPRQPSSTTSPMSLDMIPGRPKALPTRALSYSPATPCSTVNSSTRRPPLSAGSSSGKGLGRTNTRANTMNNTRVASYPDAQLSAAVHIELGIEQHEANELPQSTHHFKVAADLGDPTGCMLYGLSLRHGWGIRQDLQRSIQMLKKAVDSIGVNIDNTRESKLISMPLIGEVAVAIYELGVSYKNGWGVLTDKKLALKYFEIASNWGDVEAMIVTADCYLKGEGCKKDKAKAATYLRQAEAQGKKEIGNSWIWKSKYDT